MRYLILTISLLFIGTGCSSMYSATYHIGMEQVERPSDIEKRYGKPEIVQQDTADISKYVYSDSLITITWIPLPSQFNFELRNKTEHSMKIIWDESAFVDHSGESQRVIHAGTKYAEKNQPQPPTVIVRGGKISDTIIPSNNVEWGYNSWQVNGIFEPYASYNINELNAAKQHEGKKVQVLLPLDIQGNINEYIFSFKVNNVELPEKQTVSN